MKNYIYIMAAAAAVMSASCSKGIKLDSTNSTAGQQAITSINVSSEMVTRAVVDETDQTKINWQTGDMLNVMGFNGWTESRNTPYTLSSGEGTVKGIFSNADSDVNFISAILYPYQEKASWDEADSKLVFDIPPVQTAVPGSFDRNAAVMYIIGDPADKNLTLAVNFLKVTVTETNVHSIAIKSADTVLSGRMEVTGLGLTPASEGAFKSVRLTAGTGMCLQPGDYYIAVMPDEISTPSISYVYFDIDNHRATEKTKTASENLSFADGKNVKTITVDFTEGDISSRDAIQLWADGPYFATRNIGAASDDDYGVYYTWGGYKEHNQDLKWETDLNVTTFYENLSGEDDTATKLWGWNWRMPTETDLRNLMDKNKCTFKPRPYSVWAEFYGVEDTYQNNVVYFPAAGECLRKTVGYDYDIGDLWGIHNEGYYYSSTPGQERPAFIMSIRFNLKISELYMGDFYRDNGFSVRPVLAD